MSGCIGVGDCTWDAVVAALADAPELPTATATPAPPAIAATATPANRNERQDLGRLLAGRLPAGHPEDGLTQPPSGSGVLSGPADPRGFPIAKNSDDIGVQLLAGALHFTYTRPALQATARV
jgi:hypothetical protein